MCAKIVKRIVLISCVSKKENGPCAAKDLYSSPLFKKAWQYAKKIKPDKIFILSAKHGLLDPDKVIEKYNITLNDMKSYERKVWASNVLEQMKCERLDLSNDEFIILAGKRYYEYLCGDNAIKKFKLPYNGCKGIGCILHFLDKQIL